VNPALWLMCVLDRNEWGAVTRCTIGRYRRAFARHFDVIHDEYNGLLIGPQGKLSQAIADLLIDLRWLAPFSPKLFFRLRNR
jgi:hypothetical protein